MLVDYHIHLEEGPYNEKWRKRTLQSLLHFYPNPYPPSSIEAIRYETTLLENRLQKGCYHENWIDLYCQTAKEKGIREVGIVDHLYRFKETRAYFEKAIDLNLETDLGQKQHHWLNRVMTENMQDFITAIQDAKVRWQQQGVTLLLGIEADYFVGQEQELAQLLALGDWDFVIGSVHFIDGWGFDNPDVSTLFLTYDLKELYAKFFETIEQLVDSKLFDIVAHIDNLKVFNYRVEDEEFNTYWYDRLAKKLKQANIATEINSGLRYRYPVAESCPSPAFLNNLTKSQISITLSSDAHFPDDLGNFVAENSTLLGALNVARFRNRKRI